MFLKDGHEMLLLERKVVLLKFRLNKQAGIDKK